MSINRFSATFVIAVSLVVAVTVPSEQPAHAATAGDSQVLANSGLFFPYVTFPTGSCAEAVAISDLNNDGRNDVVVATTDADDIQNDHRIHVFLQDISGELLPPAKYEVINALSSSHPRSVDIGDLNGDGRNDVAVATSNAVGVFLQNDTGTLDPMVVYNSAHSSGSNVYKIRIGDLNNDNLLDIASIDWGTQSYSVDVFLQNQDGTLDTPAVYSVQHGGYDDMDIGDVNDDGLQDVVVMSGQGVGSTLGILMQNSQGTLGPPMYFDLTDNSLTNGVAVGDINNDSREDVVVTYPNYVGAFLQNTSGTLNPSIRYTSSGDTKPVEIGDISNDGRDDVIAAGGNVVEIHLQNSGGTLSNYELYTVPFETHYPPHSLAVGDINGDGANDVALANCGAGLVVLYNSISVSPAIGFSPTSLNPTCVQGQNASSQSFEIWNSGGATLSYTISDNAIWLSCNPAAGTSTGEHDFITVTYSTSGLAAGNYLATIAISAAGASNTPQSIPVSLIVNAPPQLTQINLVSPINGAILAAPPTFMWTANGGSGNTFAVELSLTPAFSTFWSTYVSMHQLIYGTNWIMPNSIWLKVPVGKPVYWRVRGADLNRQPLTIISSQEVFFFSR